MTEHHRTLLDDLGQAPVGSAPVAHLISGARAARRRKQRTLVAGAAAVTVLAVGGGVLTTQALTGTSDNNIAGAPGQGQNLDVNVVSGVSESVVNSFAEPLTGAAAAWNPTDETLVYVSGMNYSSSCPPEGTATVVPDTKIVTLTLRDYEGTGGCTSDAGRVTVTLDGLTAPPGELTVTAVGDTTTIPVQSPAVPSNSPASIEGTWTVQALLDAEGNSLISVDETDVTLIFQDGEMTGDTGCNGIWGEYKQSGTERDLEFLPRTLGSRAKFCADEPPVLARLTEVRTVSGTDDDVRYLHDADGKVIAELRAETDSGVRLLMLKVQVRQESGDTVNLDESGLAVRITDADGRALEDPQLDRYGVNWQGIQSGEYTIEVTQKTSTGSTSAGCEKQVLLDDDYVFDVVLIPDAECRIRLSGIIN